MRIETTETIYNKVEEIISPVYLVGGSVRDEIMGNVPQDYDFATPLGPDAVEEAVRQSGRRPYLTGKRFGTVGIRLEGHTVEITTFRTERYREGNRRPEVVFVDDITADLSRRDFTINAMARRKSRIIDPFGGQKDIEQKIIRSVGNPSARFREDPLRMLRAARFAAQFAFVIDESTLKAMTKLNYKILEVSKERWCMELDKILLSNHPDQGLNYLMDTGLFRYLIPELWLQRDYDQRSRYHLLPLWDHTVLVTCRVEADIHLRWAALLHDIAKPFVRIDKEDRSIYAHHDILGYEMAVRLGRYLKWPTERIREVSELVRSHLKDDSPLKKADNASKGI